MPPSVSLMRRRPVADHLVSGILWGAVVAFIFGVGAGAWWTLDQIESAVRDSVRRNLTTSLARAREVTRHWATRQQAFAATLAANGAVSGAAARLTAPLNRRRTDVRERAARDLLAAVEEPLRTNGLGAYWVVDDAARVVARNPESLARSLPPDANPMVSRALDGLPGIGPLGPPGSGPHLGAFAPIRDDKGRVIAALVLALPAERDLSRMADQGQFRSEGRTLFFDQRARLVGGTPGTLAGAQGRLLYDPATGALTRMALAATRGRPGLDLEGYPDHRGRQVVGAWTWDDQLGLGIAAEVEVKEAFHVVEVARRALGAACIITLVLFLGVVLSLLQARRRAATLSGLQRRLAAVLESTTDPVCFADASGEAIYLNDAGRALIGGPEYRSGGADSPPPRWARLLLSDTALAQAAQAGTWNGEVTILTVDGREITVSQVILCHRDPSGEVQFYSTSGGSPRRRSGPR
jgi:PAS domain-containing protein